MYRRTIKPLLDFLSSLIILFIVGPVFLFVLCALFIANNGAPFFYQQRPGKGEGIFTIIKFKTMNDRKDTDGVLLPDSQRLTAIGRFVRKTSLDELPQLLNVVMGQMSIVGPRPLLPEYLPLYTDVQKKRHEVKPGITGWAQVNGRNAISWNKKFEYDVWYVEHQSFVLDVKIVFKTIEKVIGSKDINKAGEATSSRFKGKGA